MKRQPILSLVIGLVFVAVLSGYTQQSAKQLLQSGLYKEDVKGDLDAAIQIYRTIIQDFPNHRSVASKALLQMGQCYEKLGKAEARKVYQRVLREYADQAEQVGVARTRLAALTRGARSSDPSTMVVRRIWSGPDVDILGAVFREGRYLSFVHWETGDLAIRDLETGKNRRLTNKGSWFEPVEFALFSKVSPDGKQVAYAWFNEGYFYDLRIVGLNGSEPRVLYRNEEVEYVHPHAWSPDGKHILATFSRKDTTNQIVLVSVADGSLRVVKTLDWRYPQKMSFSPDGRYIAYDFPPQEDSRKRDIFLLAADGSRETSLVEHPANDLFPVWAPDGKRILFASDRTGSMGAWLIQVADGKPRGSPELVKPDIGRILPMGFTRKGSFYYGLQTGMNDVYTATLDLATGKLLSAPMKASQRFMGSNRAPDWSPDGQYLAYLSQRGPSPGGRGLTIIVIRSLETGEERELSPQLNYVRLNQGLRWSPNGQSIIVTGRDKKGRRGFYQIDSQTGDVTPIVQSETYVFQPECSPDGRAIFYTRPGSITKKSSIVVRDLESGEERELLHAVEPSFIRPTMILSPDGQRLAFLMANTETRSTALMVMPAAGGEARELLRVQEPEWIPNTNYSGLAWTPDSREVIFGWQRRPQEQKIELWQISAEGGEPRRLGSAMDQLRPRHLRFHPDGRRIAFDAGESKGEVWVMENFLPELSSTE